jgi:hypothetical protein
MGSAVAEREGGESMTNGKRVLMTAAVVFAELASNGVVGPAYPATGREVPPRAIDPSQDASRPVAPTRIAQDTPRPDATRPGAAQGTVVIPVEVVDPQGRPLAGAEVILDLRYGRGSEPADPTFERSRTDGTGRVRFEIARERSDATLIGWQGWAYQPGRALAVGAGVRAGAGSPPPMRLTVDEPARSKIAVLGPDDRPMAGIRVAPHSFRRATGRNQWFIVPDDWANRLTQTTDARGVVPLNFLSRDMLLMAVRVAGPGIAPHALPFEPPQGDELVLRLGRPGRLTGIVRTESGQTLADVPVEVWVQGTGTVPGAILNRRITQDEVVRLDPPALRTGAQGAFQTPRTLLGGSKYRVSVRRDGFVPFVSEWVAMEGDRTTIPEIRLRGLRTVTGRVIDRQGRAIPGVRVFLPSGGPGTSSDAEGRFALAGIPPGTTVILVERGGFRLQGQLVDPATRSEVGSLTLVRTGESPGAVMKPLADPIPHEEARALADRLLAPYLPEDPGKGEDRAWLAAIEALGQFDLDRALELLQDRTFRDDDFLFQSTRASLAARAAETDPASAEALVEAIPDPLLKARALADVAGALPALEGDRKRDLLERASLLFRERLRQAPPLRRLEIATKLAERWLDLGDRGRARPLLEEAKSIVDSSLTRRAPDQIDVLTQLARVDPEQALARLQKSPGPPDIPAAVAVRLATDHPAAAEKAFNLGKRVGIPYQFDHYILQLCRRLARVDPPRARRLAASQRGPAERSLAWAHLALGLAEAKQTGAEEAIDQAIREIDRLRESGPGNDLIIILGSVCLMYPTNPAPLILPIVERVAPERLSEVFWRAVSLHPRINPDRMEQVKFSYIGLECTLLARYDREVAAVLFRPMDAYLRSLAAAKVPQDQFNAASIVALGCIDPRGAVALLDSFAPPRQFSPSHPYHAARLRLAEALGLSPDKRWKRLWRGMAGQLTLDD